jgi:hypothetical protein
MRIHLLLCGLFLAATNPAFAQSAATASPGLGNYNFSTINGGMRTPGARPGADFGLGGSGMGNGNIDTGYGIGSKNAATGLSVNGSGLSEGASNLPSPGMTDVPSPGGKLHPMH